MGAFGNSGITRFLLTSLLLLNAVSATPVSKNPAAPTTPAEIFEGVTRPAPAPGPEMEWVFNQPATGARVRTAFDLELIDVESSYRAFQAANAKLIGGVAINKSSPAAALEAVKSLLKDPQTQTTLATLRTRPELRTADGLQNLAAAALATGRPLLALGGLWLAEERWPGDPQIRFNLASLLAQHGAVNEAQALLDELAAQQRLPVHPFGITAQQGADYLRAYILMRQGRIEEAARLLKPIVAANPSFGEAALLFALVAPEPEEEARAAYIAGIWRRRIVRPVSSQPPTDAGGKADAQENEDKKHPPKRSRSRRTGLDAALLVDLSKGKPGELPAIPQPVSLEDRVEYMKWLIEVTPAVHAESLALLEARNAPMERCRQKDLPKPVRRRLMALERIIEPENSHLPELLTLNRALNQAIGDMTNAHQRIGDKFIKYQLEITARMDLDGDQKCALITPMAEAAAASMRVHVQAVDLATRRLHRRWHQYATALGALTADPDFRAYLDAHIKASSQVTYEVLLSNISESCTFLGCEPKKPGQKNELGKPEGGALAQCSEEDAKKSVGAEVNSEIAGPVKPINASVGIEATCDGISVEVGMELFKTVGLSAEVEFKTDGTCTLYLGPKITMGVGGAEASSKGGVYFTVNNKSFENPIQDAGVRGVVKTTVKAGLPSASATASYTGSDTRISLFAGPTVPVHNAGGLANFR